MTDDDRDDDEALALEPGQRLFGVAEADALVPFLARTFDRLGEMRAELAELLEALAPLGVLPGQPLPPEMAAAPEVTGPVARVIAIDGEIRGILTELQETGVEVKSFEGLVDVRSRYDGRVVYLCWQRGEGAFTHWHELEGGYAGRQPILDRAAYHGSLLA
ncbi:MAG: DUF2203 domain-containing protein [Myxococcales bacterium]|nr:DUF2203 domain-containing protein [Myxococcales bacterium]MCB9735409.1 DUF2203 domain-containing protein [Deltaproteobacteria bacterium]